MRYHVVKDFFGGAEAMRHAFDSHFAEPNRHSPAAHQIWNYWHVPRLYTYLRTQPDKLMPRALVADFLRTLKTWSLTNLGLDGVIEPTLSLYVSGCGQGLHNDSGNGRWGYVFSLTRWQERHFLGGETLLFRDTDYADSARLSRPGARSSFADFVEPEFNQLLVFDDRMIHGVERVEGSMNPHDGRVVLHGHIREGGCLVQGGLNWNEAQNVLAAARRELGRWLETARGQCVGVLSFRLHVTPDGDVRDLSVLTDQVSRAVEGGVSPAWVSAEIGEYMRRLRFPAKDQPTLIIVPITLE